ncbi:MAG: nucleoside phosphorylase [Oscillospiraceae bacterium]|nr:nucleoside phosphorylase [Oscillospiraceae bacterium]
MGTENTVKATAPTVGDKVYHLRLAKGEISPYVVLPGDQNASAHVEKIWQGAKQLAYNREYKTVAGKYEDMDIAMTSTGIGCQPAEICVNELKKIGVHTCIKVGCAESIREDIAVGDIIIPFACMRKGGAVTHYVQPEFPAFCAPEATKALIQACTELGYKYTLGVVCSISSYYIGQARPINGDENSYWPMQGENLIAHLQNSRVSAIDMETAGTLIMGYLHGLRMGAVLGVNANRVTNEWLDEGGQEKACRVASRALKILKEKDDMGKAQ